MSELEKKVREAVAAGGGDAQASVRALAAMVERDERLLRALVKPFLAGILLHAVQRASGAGRTAQVKAAEAGSAKYEQARKGPGKPGIAVPGDGKPGQRPVQRSPRRPRALPVATLDAVLERWSETIPVAPPPPAPPHPRTPAEVLKSIGKDPNAEPRPTQAGKRHQTAIHALASSFGGPKRRG